ncbi:hypothetical protein MESS4_p50011 [Mesorhizobium sp. STM 4661]|nr:hypothetical protein MESS4_p50011 [Mesorhizobium sp. STM 4661]
MLCAATIRNALRLGSCIILNSAADPLRVRYACVRPLRLRLRGDRAQDLNTTCACRAGMDLAQGRCPARKRRRPLDADHRTALGTAANW